MNAEIATIGSVLIAPDSFPILSFLDPEDFKDLRHRWIWQSFQNLYKRDMAIDILTITDDLEDNKKLSEIGGIAYLSKISGSVPSSLHAEDYAKKVKEESIKRLLIDEANRLAVAANNGQDVNEIIANTVHSLSNMGTIEKTGRQMFDVMMDVGKQIDTNIEKRLKGEKIDTGLQTGIGYIDRNFLGLLPGWLVMLAGPPGAGKSYLAAQMGKVFTRQAPGDYIVLEGSEAGIIYRLMAGVIGCDPTEVEFGNITPEESTRAQEEIAELDMKLFYTARMHIQELRAYLAKEKAKRGIKWAIIDYISLLTVPRMNKQVQEDEYLSTELRKIANEYEILILGLDSVTKAGAEGIMRLQDIRGSFGKQHDADVSLGMSGYYPIEGIAPPILSGERKRNCRILGVMKDRYRSNKGKLMPLEKKGGMIMDMI